jgi:hypothetical protein
MRVDCEILIDRVEQTLAVPLASIFAADGKSWVFVRTNDGLKPTSVKLGRVNNEFAQVTEGLQAGQDVRFLQIGEGAELLARAGIKVSTEGSDRGFANGNRQNGNRRAPNASAAGSPTGPGGINAESSGAATPNPNTAAVPQSGGGEQLNPGGAPGSSEGGARPGSGGRRGGRRGAGGSGPTGGPAPSSGDGATPSGGGNSGR